MVRESGPPVLDVGCGTGRLLLDFMEQGIETDGVDNSPEMLELLREKAAKMGIQPNVYFQQMEELDLPRRYQTIIVPSSSFQLVIDPEKAREAMRRFYSQLLPGGTLAMPFMVLYRKLFGENREAGLGSGLRWGATPQDQAGRWSGGDPPQPLHVRP